ncbi:uncharacterized protein FFB20_15703 [Fusarium fujikuroi]|nr:uncharacterized protein FFB20_15703 [Fusarium fujikuroi]
MNRSQGDDRGPAAWN